jgi:N-acyl-D-aspartate/D-glutamate deacylase
VRGPWKRSVSPQVIADRWNRANRRPFSDEQLVRMVTRNPAAALGWGDGVGQIREGLFADMVVIDRRRPDAYRNLIEATEENVQLVLVGGAPTYGDRELMQRLRGPDWEVVGTIGGRPKVVHTTRGQLDPSDTTQLTFARVRAKLLHAFEGDSLLKRTGLDSIFTAEDTIFFKRIRANRNVPAWLAGLDSSYRQP